jgi:single-strand DNA-binding protein
MTYCLNQATLLGFIGEPPVIIDAIGGRIGLMRLCTIERWSSNDQARERVQWHTVICRADKYLPLFEHGLLAGQMVLVRGQLEHRSYTDGKALKERWVSEIVVHSIGGTIIGCGEDAGTMQGLASCMNEVVLVGKLGTKPKAHEFENGGRNCVVRLATSERFKGGGSTGEKERVQWHTVVCRNEALIPFMTGSLDKGSFVVVHGQVEYRPVGADGGLVTEVAVRPFCGSIIGCDRSAGSNRGAPVPFARNPGLSTGLAGRSRTWRSERPDPDADDDEIGEAPFIPSVAVA